VKPKTKKVLLWVIAGLLVLYAIRYPQEAAAKVVDILGDLRAAAEAIITFFRSLFE
jgi:hypothetical protein